MIAALGVALLYLSNPRERCYILSANREEHVASVYDVVLVAEKLKDMILDRLHQDPSISALDDIVMAAEEALSSGYIWSVSDFHLHLEQAVQVSTIVLSVIPTSRQCEPRSSSLILVEPCQGTWPALATIRPDKGLV